MTTCHLPIHLPVEGNPGTRLTLGSANVAITVALEGHPFVDIAPGEMVDFLSFVRRPDGTVTHDAPKEPGPPTKIGWAFFRRTSARADARPGCQSCGALVCEDCQAAKDYDDKRSHDGS